MTAPVIPLALIEDDDSYRRFIRRLCDTSGRYRCVATWADAESALAAIVPLAPRVVLLDVMLPGLPGYAALPELRRLLPDALVLMLSSHGQDDIVFESLRAGAMGYLLKTEEPAAIVEALDEALAGGAPMTSAIARRVVASFTQRPAQPVPTVASAGAAELTAREREVLDLLAAGLAYKEIAQRLTLSPATVKNHLANVYSKLQVRSATEAVSRWLRR